MSRVYIVSKATHLLFAGLTRPGHTLRDTAVARPDGQMELTLDDEVTERLEAHRLEGESDDELIERVLRTAEHGVN